MAEASRADNGASRAANGATAASGRFTARLEAHGARRVTALGRTGMGAGRSPEPEIEEVGWATCSTRPPALQASSKLSFDLPDGQISEKAVQPRSEKIPLCPSGKSSLQVSAIPPR